MKPLSVACFWICSLLICLAHLNVIAADDFSFQLKKNQQDQWSVVAGSAKPGLTDELLKKLNTPSFWMVERLPGPEESGQTPVPVAGRWALEKGLLTFQPKYPFREGLRFQVVQRPESGGSKVLWTFAIPSEGGPAPEVVSLQPGRKNWPENILRVYLHFNRPMARGEAVKRISIHDETGRVLVQPFLELDQELWDRDGRRLTLLFDPGRVKSGLKPREEDGAIFENGHKYTISVAAGWPDELGVPTAARFETTVTIGPADLQPVQPRQWKINAPESKTVDPLEIQFDEPVDTGMAVRLISVLESGECPLDGDAVISANGLKFQFKPRVKWSPGLHFIEVSPALEDSSGNQVGRPFERDMKADRESLMKDARPVRLTFIVKAPE